MGRVGTQKLTRRQRSNIKNLRVNYLVLLQDLNHVSLKFSCFSHEPV